MRRRPALLALALLSTAAAGAPAHAAKKVCNLIVDGANDSRYGVPAHDLRGGDIATGPTKLVAAIRVVSIADEPRAKVYGATYRFNFTIAKVKYMLEFRRSLVAADAARLVASGTQPGPTPEVKIDTAGNQVIFTVPRTAFKNFKPGSKITELNLDTGTGTVAVINTDDAKPKPTTAYVDRTPSCLAAG